MLKNIHIIGNYGAGNLGDDAILLGIISELRALGFAGKISAIHGGVESSKDIYEEVQKTAFKPCGIRSIIKSFLSAKQKNTETKADYVIFGGGGLFTDEESCFAPYIWFMQILPYIRTTVPYLVYGQSFSHLKFPWNKLLLKFVLKKAKAVHVRDKVSFDICKSYGISAYFGADPAFSAIKKWEMTDENKKSTEKNNTLILSLRDWNFESAKALKKIIPTLKSYALENSIDINLLYMQKGENLDLEKFSLSEITCLKPESAKEAYEIIKTAKIAVLMRLHANIFALGAGRLEFLTLAYSSKVASLVKFFTTKKERNILSFSDLNSGDSKKFERHLNKLFIQRKSKNTSENAALEREKKLSQALSENLAFLKKYLV